VPRVIGVHHLSLSVTDLERSVAFYRDVLGFERVADLTGPGFLRARLRHAGTEFMLTLTAHEEGRGGRFDPRRPGLDHVAFWLPSPEDVDAFAVRLDERGIERSAVRVHGDPPGDSVVLPFRDPDGVQLEVFAHTG
jgi:glyoxylase I family protein